MSTLDRPSSRRPDAQPLTRQAPVRSERVEIIHPDQYADRRAEPRTACDDHGALLMLPGEELVTCRIIDQSPSGARVAFDKVTGMPTDIWLIDVERHTARHGTAAWSTLNRMGLKFDLIQQLTPGGPRPPKVPQVVYDAWLKLAGIAAGPDQGDDDVLYFD